MTLVFNGFTHRVVLPQLDLLAEEKHFPIRPSPTHSEASSCTDLLRMDDSSHGSHMQAENGATLR